MREKAYAKINIVLDVVSRREDGYHELDMIMLPIDFYDQIEIKIAPQMSLSTSLTHLPIDDKNTVIKAIEVLREEYGFNENFEIILNKHIPTQAGLAGGSADAAATIRILNKLLKLNMSFDKMLEVGKKVGADVPFCIGNKPARVKGIGEKLEFFKMKNDFHLFLVKPQLGVSTKLAFEALNFDEVQHPNVDVVKQALIDNDYECLMNNLENTLEYSAFKLVPEIQTIKEELLELGFDGVLMSGSGSTVFAITKNEKLIAKATKIFKAKRMFVRKTKVKL